MLYNNNEIKTPALNTLGNKKLKETYTFIIKNYESSCLWHMNMETLCYPRHVQENMQLRMQY